MYNRRVRHLTLGALGSTMATDSRSISGVADGATVQTWTDLTGNGNSPTQGTAGNRPTYEEREVGGCPVLSFSAGASNFMEVTLNMGSTFDVFMGIRAADVASSNRGILGPSASFSTGFEALQVEVISVPCFLRINNVQKTTGATRLWGNGTPSITQIKNDSVLSATFNGDPVSLSNTTAETIGSTLMALARYATTAYATVDFFFLRLNTASLSASLTKRINQSYGYSFKIPCA